MIGVAIEVYSAVSNYYGRYAKTLVEYVKTKHTREPKHVERANSVDELEKVEGLGEENPKFKLRKNYMEFFFNSKQKSTKHHLF